MNLYTIIGIIQYQLNGEWQEQTVLSNIKADTTAQAQGMILTAFLAPLQQRDLAQARWNTPEMVRSIKA